MVPFDQFRIRFPAHESSEYELFSENLLYSNGVEKPIGG